MANLLVEEPDALVCARPDLWEPREGNDPGPPGTECTNSSFPIEPLTRSTRNGLRRPSATIRKWSTRSKRCAETEAQSNRHDASNARGSPASLKENDVIRSVNGQTVRRLKDFAIVWKERVRFGDATLNVWRNQAELSVVIPAP